LILTDKSYVGGYEAPDHDIRNKLIYILRWLPGHGLVVYMVPKVLRLMQLRVGQNWNIQFGAVLRLPYGVFAPNQHSSRLPGFPFIEYGGAFSCMQCLFTASQKIKLN